MEVGSITIFQIVEVIGIIGVIGGAILAVFKFWFGYEKRFTNIENRIDVLETESKSNKTENKLMLRSILACLKGLSEQGCDGPVTESINEIEDYLIKK